MNKKLLLFQREISNHLYNVQKDKKKIYHIADIYEKYYDLFEVDKIKECIKKIESSKPCPFQRELVKEFFIFNVQLFQHKIEIEKSLQKVEIQGLTYTIKEAQGLMIQEKDNYIRALIFNKVEEIYKEKILPLHIEMFEHLDYLSKKLGFQGYIDLYSTLLPYNINEVLQEFKKIISHTDYLYRITLNEVSKNIMNKEYIDLGRCDLSEIWRVDKFSSYFEFSNVKQKFTDTITCLNSTRILNSVDIQINSASGRSFCLPAVVPNKILLMINKRNRPDDYKTFYHEVGHAIHLASLSENLVESDKYWADNSINETFAFIFERLLYDKKYMNLEFGIEHRDYFQALLFYRLYQLRHYSAKAIWEIENFGLDPINNMENWRKISTQTLLIESNGMGAYLDRDLFLNSLTYVRSWILEAQIRSVLVNRFGDQWYKNKESGRFLIKLWNNTSYYKAENFATTLGFKKLDSNYLINELNNEFFPLGV